MTVNRLLVTYLLTVSNCLAATQSPRGYGRLPLVFERNLGQTDHDIRFLARGRKYTAAIADDGVKLRLKKAPDTIVQLQLLEKDRNAHFETPDKLPGISNYFIGNDRRRWIQGIPQYGKVWQRGVYPGVDLAYYGNQGQLEYDFVVHPGADPDRVRLRFSGVNRMRVDDNGDLVLSVNGSELRQKLPVSWQERDGKRSPVAVRYRLLAGNTVGLSIAEYDHSRSLVIDPVLVLAYSTFLGGSMADQGNGIAVDTLGNAWIAGTTTSADFPVNTTPKPTLSGSSDAFVAKIDPTGTTLLISTYLGGSGADQANAIAVDPTGNAYIAGSTNSPNFPVTTPLQAANAGGLDAFAMKLNASGMMIYSTYIGGTADDAATAIAADSNNAAYIAGYTSSTNFPTATPQQSTNHGGKDAFILKLNASGTVLVYSTYLGGLSDDQANGIAVDTQGSAYVAGATASNNFPISAALQPTAAGGFVTKFSPSGIVVYSTYLGGSLADVANAIAVDSSGDAFVVGATSSTKFPVVNAFQPGWSDAGGPTGTSDAYLAKLNPAGTGLVFSTYFGGASTGAFSIVNPHPGGPDVAYGVAVDGMGNAYITGSTTVPGTLASSPLPAFPLQDAFAGYDGPQAAGAGVGLTPWYHPDAFLASFSPTGSLLYSTDIGGLLDDVATAVAVDGTGAAYITGYTRSSDFPVQSAIQNNNPAACLAASPGCATSEAFVSKFTFSTTGARVFFGAEVPSDASLSQSVPIVITGTGCSPGGYTAPAGFVQGSLNPTLGVPVIFQPAANCTVNVLPTAGSSGTRYGFAGWTDGVTTNPRMITAPAHGTAYTIELAPQYQLTTSVTPPGGGTVTVTPSSPDGYYNSGANVTLTAVPGPGYIFSNFSGDVVGITNGQNLTISGPRTVTAVFVPSGSPNVSIDQPVNGATISGSVMVTGWAIDNTSAPGTAISQVKVKVDGVVVGNATYGSVRMDVCSVYPLRPGCPNVGFTFTLNANTLLPGPHTLTVTATDSDGTPDMGSASVIVTSSLMMTGTKAAVFRNGMSFLADTNGNGLYDAGVDRFVPSFTPPGGAQAGDLPVVGDWTGDGHAKVGIYRPSTGTWWLDANNDGVFNAGDYTYQFGGLTGDLPVVGDWNGVAGASTHKDCIGIYRTQGSVWLLDLNCNGLFDNTPLDAFFPFGGIPGDVPVVGRWTGGLTMVGVVRKYSPGGVPQGNPFFWVTDSGAANAGNLPANHPPSATPFAFGGLLGDVFVTGDWNNTGTSLPGVYRNGLWVTDAANTSASQSAHVPGFTFGYGGVAGDVPVPGKW